MSFLGSPSKMPGSAIKVGRHLARCIGLLLVFCLAPMAGRAAHAQPGGPTGLSAEAERRAVEDMQRRGLQVPSLEERRRLIEMFAPGLGGATFDTTPLRFEIAGVRLAIPANHVASVDRDADGKVVYLALHIFLFDMQGVTAVTAPCLRRGFACPEYARLNIMGSPVVSGRQALANVQRAFPEALERLPGPNGLEMLRFRRRAPDGSGSFYLYAEQPGEDQLVLARCTTIEGGQLGNCLTRGNLVDGLALRYIFRGDQSDHLLRIDALARALLRRFIEAAR